MRNIKGTRFVMGYKLIVIQLLLIEIPRQRRHRSYHVLLLYEIRVAARKAQTPEQLIYNDNLLLQQIDNCSYHANTIRKTKK
jgi:hypothetical protein